MQIIVTTGDTGAGKSTYTFIMASQAMWESMKANKKYPDKPIRNCVSNLLFAENVEEFYGISPLMKGYKFRVFNQDGTQKEIPVREQYIRKDGIIAYWQDPDELPKWSNADIVWDEIARHLDSTQWANMSLVLKAWFQEHRKLGNDIYANTQDFDMVDKSVRRLCHVLYYNTKIIGSRDISANRPPPKHPWGLVIRKSIDPKSWDPEKISSLGRISGAFCIRKENVFGFDTRQRIRAGTYPPMHHIERSCEKPGCTFHKVVHA